MQPSFFILPLGLLACTAFGQSPAGVAIPGLQPSGGNSTRVVRYAALADTTRVLHLIAEGYRYIDKPGDEKRDFDSAAAAARRALTISRRLGYVTGQQDALLLSGLASLHGKQWSPASAIYPLLDPPQRIRLLSEMIFFFGDSVAFAPVYNRARPWVDSLLARLPDARTESLMHDAATAIGWFCHAIHDPARGGTILTRGLRKVRGSGNSLLETKYVWETGVWLSSDSAYTPLVVSFARQLADDDEQWLPRNTVEEQCRAIQSFAELGNQYIQSTTPDACVRIESLAMRVTQRLQLHFALPWCTLACLYSKQGKTQEALSLILDGVRISETPHGPFNGYGYEFAAELYFAMGEFEKGLDFFNKCVALLKKDPNLLYDAGGLFSYAIRAYLKQHRPAEAYQLLKTVTPLNVPLDLTGQISMELVTADTWYALGRNDSAEKYYLKTLSYYKDNRFYQFERSTSLAAFYVGTGQFARARPLLEWLTADSNSSSINPIDQEKNWHLRYRVDSSRNDYRMAMTDLLKYQFFHDSLTNDNKNKQIAEINIKFETDKKNQHIADLEKQTLLQNRLQQSTARQNSVVRNSLIAGAALLALFAAILYKRWRTRRRMSLQLEKLTTRQQKLISEKEWLLREIHHRVKNNLQIIISLLRLQSGQLKDEIAISAFEVIGARVNSISLVHKKLYQEGQNMALIDMRDYIRDLVSYLREGFNLDRRIGFQLDVDAITLDVAQCVPLGLILNEAVTNAIKYAFPSPARAQSSPADISAPPPLITISLQKGSEKGLFLRIADNGIGLPPGYDPVNSKSLGLQLIQTLVLQLEGCLAIEDRHGLHIHISFTPHADMNYLSN